MTIISTGEKTSVELQEYNGIYSLMAMRDYNGKSYQIWGRVELGKDKTLSDKSQPFKCVLGDIDTAIGVSKMITQELEQIRAGNKPEEDVPF